MGRFREFWVGETDIAPVALFRILFGLLLLNWFWQLFPNLTAFFTDAGILPRHELARAYPDRPTDRHPGEGRDPGTRNGDHAEEDCVPGSRLSPG